jgi:hypothetical protein
MSWHPLAKAALENPEAFIEYFPQLPKRIRSLVKNMDQRLSVPPHIEEQVRGFSKADRHLLNALVSAFQCFPLHTRFPPHLNIKISTLTSPKFHKIQVPNIREDS